MKISLCLFFIIASTAVFAQTPAIVLKDNAAWHKIGETTVNFRTESDEVVVTGADRFASIKFRVSDAPVQINSIEVFFDSGDSKKMDLNISVKAPGETDSIALDGGERKLDRISFEYKTLSNTADNKAHLEVYGLKK